MLKKISKIILFSLIALAVVGAIYQKIQADADLASYPAHGKMYDVDGLQLHLDCRGEGSPTIVMEAGLMSGSMSWLKIDDALAKKTRFCAYDRPGLDWSEAIAHTADADEITDRLHKLLALAGINDDKILVGMSAGGVYMREYYQKYPENIIGMVFIDSSHEQQSERLPKIAGAETIGNVMNACRFMQPLGVIRAFSLLSPYLDTINIDDQAKKQWLANLNQSHACSAIYWELQSFNAELAKGVAPKSLGDLPLLVLTHGKEAQAEELINVSKDDIIAMNKVWQVLQKELAALSTDSEQFIAYQSGHPIQLDQPELVIETISNFVDKIRASNTIAAN